MTANSDERAFLIAAAAELSDYLLSDASTWQLSGSGSLPLLTPGYVLFFLKRCSVRFPEEREDKKLQSALAEIAEVRQRWNSAWKKRIGQEIPQRLRLWSNYMDELVQSRNQAGKQYRWSVRWRVMLNLLEAELLDPVPKSGQRIKILDEQLRSISLPGAFVWEPWLEGAYPRSDYWFLFVKIEPTS